MTTILECILEEKRKEVIRLKEEMREIPPHNRRKNRSFLEILQKGEEFAIIAEFKRASPSKGILNMNAVPQTQGLTYLKYGADAVSVLTDGPFFKGSFEDLAAISEAVDAPVLCKDFIIDEVQIIRAKIAGADMILLIAAALNEYRLKELYNFAIGSGLEALIEVHNELEIEKAIKTGTRLIGVNNRDLKTFTVDLAITERLASFVKKHDAFLISESGIKTEGDVKRVIAAGANGILVGEAFMNTANLEKLFIEMKRPLIEVTKQ